jgi:XTP/dITP diphosphohydrolase
MKLIFATNNKHKIDELKEVVGSKFELLTLNEAGIDQEIPEPYDTLEENASEKSKTIYQLTGINCFADDTGLEVDALNGEPGVNSARYAGDERSFEKNTEKLLQNLTGERNRKAKFRSVISLIMDGNEYLFEGICHGQIAEHPRGKMGFGYDPVFVPDGESRTFAEMTLKEKNFFNHRRIAMDKLLHFLNTEKK